MRNIITALFVSLLFFCFSFSLNAQLSEKIRDVITNEASNAETIRNESHDSIRIAELERVIETYKADADSMRLEMEHFALQKIIDDSIRKVKITQRMDSLRKVTKGEPVEIGGDTLFWIYAKRGGYLPKERARDVVDQIKSMGESFSVVPDSIYVGSYDNVSDILYKNKVIASVTDQDALWAGVPMDSLANERRVVIIDKIKELQSEHGLFQYIKRALLFILILFGQYLIFRVVYMLYKKVKVWIISKQGKFLKPISFHEYEVLNTARQLKVILFLTNVFRYLIILVLLIITVPLLFAIFPKTETLAITILGYIWHPVRMVLGSIVEYIPKLFIIIVIYFSIKYVIKGLDYIAVEIEKEKLKINGFYADWAQPTASIVRFLLYAFMIAMIYPYLPGADSGVFQGISVFVGLIVSLGSSAVIGNIMAGLVITYMRPFKIGDRIKLNDTLGNVIEKTPFVTRIRTPKNEIVTIPNSFMMSSHTVNYSSSARDFGLILHTEVTIGYDAPWREVHRLLIEAAKATNGVEKYPEPFVLETALNDWYPVYQINAYIKNADLSASIYSELHQNIQDYFNAAGVEIMSPHYMSMRDGNASTVVPPGRESFMANQNPEK